MKKILLILGFVIAFVSCENNSKQPQQSQQATPKKHVVVPEFKGDSAYYFVKAQCDFGPRVPGTMAHQQCAEWMVETLNDYCDTVYIQDFKTRVYDGKVFDGKNIIATFNPNARKRIVIAAHWDSRP